MKDEMKFVKGDTTEKKFKHINKILTRLARKSVKVAVGIVPPIPISSYVKEVPQDEGVFRFIFPYGPNSFRGSLFTSYVYPKMFIVFIFPFLF